jgi:hypothetical protein
MKLEFTIQNLLEMSTRVPWRHLIPKGKIKLVAFNGVVVKVFAIGSKVYRFKPGQG